MSLFTNDEKAINALLELHKQDFNNPHNVTAEQLGLSNTKNVRTVRYVIGTSTNGWTQDDCDYLCDGVDDQVEIQAAIDALPALGGEIVILRGDYHMTDNLILKDNVAIIGELNYWPNSQINYASRVTLQKQGSARKIIKGADKVVLENIFTIMYELNFANSCQAIIRNCNMWITGKLTNTLIENCNGMLDLQGLTYSRILNYTGYISINTANRSCIIGGQESLSRSGGININLAVDCIIANVILEIGASTALGLMFSDHNLIIGNHFVSTYYNYPGEGTIHMNNSNYNLIIGNYLESENVADSCCLSCNGNNNLILGNVFRHGNYLNNGTGNQFINNVIHDEVTSA